MQAFLAAGIVTLCCRAGAQRDHANGMQSDCTSPRSLHAESACPFLQDQMVDVLSFCSFVGTDTVPYSLHGMYTHCRMFANDVVLLVQLM